MPLPGLHFSEIQIGDVLSGTNIGLVNMGMGGEQVAQMGVGIAQAIATQQALSTRQQRVERDRQTRLALVVGAVVLTISLIVLLFFLFKTPKPILS